MPILKSLFLTMFIAAIGCQKLGQPVWESNLVLESYSAVSQQMQRYSPEARLPSYSLLSYSPLNAISVPAWRVTR
jgi:hypothetical protein